MHYNHIVVQINVLKKQILYGTHYIQTIDFAWVEKNIAEVLFLITKHLSPCVKQPREFMWVVENMLGEIFGHNRSTS